MRRRCRLYLLALGFVLALVPKAPAQDATFVTIDPPDSDHNFTACLDINDRGQIVGLYNSTPDGHRHGFLRSEDGAYARIDFPGSTATHATGINPRGQIVGHTLVSGKRHGYLREENGEFTQIDFPGAMATLAIGIDPRGDIVGRYCVNTPPQCANGNRNAHGFLLSRGEFTTIDVPGALETHAYKINARRQILGSYLGPEGKSHLFLLSEGEFTTIDFPNALETPTDGGQAGINRHGDIVSFYCAAPPLPCTDENFHGFLFSEGEFTAIDVPGALGTGAAGINNRGDVVGFYNPSHSLGFLRTGGERGGHEKRDE
jgi:uncharacterized membrane protein